MKKIDFHIHTVSSVSDREFTFSLSKLNEYISSREIDGIAITNHNLFDLDQFNQIKETVPIQVFPGIEIDVDDGHLLLIADGTELADFDSKCKEISAKIPADNDSVSVTELKFIFPDLSKYILIPHYSKKPELSDAALAQLGSTISAGEVASPKKFQYCLKDRESLVPVYFSDQRIDENLIDFSVRQTYIDCAVIDFSGVKICLQDKNKVFLAKEDGHHFFDALASGVKLSTGLNVILGERSTGKSYTLNQIDKTFENVKYIKQFSLLERDEEADKKRFNDLLTRRQSLLTQDHLKPFKDVVDKMVSVDLEQNERAVDRYLLSLLKNAQESEKSDSFSSSSLFNEVDFSESDFSGLKSLIDSTKNLIENTEYRDLIEEHVELASLKSLAVALMSKYAEETELNLKKRFLNDLIGNIKKGLHVRSAITPIDDVDFYMIAMNRKKIDKFDDVAKALKQPCEIQRKDIQGFKVVATRKPFGGAQELKNMSGRRTAFSTAFSSYSSPYKYLIRATGRR
ncbi:PHP domain-containing protein [Pontiella sulfatireligans]|uniref:Polymerase/histidinol phosphatase N-terminal domain-containing protein n=1 Tax=Pontiella sulfatireligans TaxID=2750658 RepID=A0A6C2UKJ9_9BACT|nr:PHP domain-containing protein [Pontiella sulfatireligans]VGO20762.1 hypothetical protein SCARR_02829 [Pontiella sulfatireligans]